MNPIDVLGKIIAISHSNLEIASRINAILNIIAQDMPFGEAIVYTLDTDKRLTCRHKNDKSTLFHLLNEYRSHIGEGIVGSVAQKRMPQYFTIKDVPPRLGCLFYPDLDGYIEKYKAFSFLPLSDDSYFYGVLFVGSSSKERLNDSEKVFLSMVAREIGGILRSNQLIISSKKRISELATLSELGKVLSSNAIPRDILNNIAFIIAKASNASFVTIRLAHSFLKLDTQRFTYGDFESTSEEEVIRLEEESKKRGKTVSPRDLAPEGYRNTVVTSFYSAPLTSKGRFLGTVTIGESQTVSGPTVEENGRYLIETIANYISSGLENTLLTTKLKDVVNELNSAQKRLLEQETFRNLGEMTANIAHEIKNPLVIIGGFTKRLAKKVRLDHTENKYVEIILKEVVRLEAILDEILNYVKESPMVFKECTVSDFIDELVYLFTSDQAWEKTEITREYDNDVPSVPCDDQQIKQVIINILMNAHDAMHGPGKITIQTGRKAINDRPFASISITDSGGGIDPAIIDNIFNPFFTTKEKGTGLGLAISNKIVLNHGGHIQINNIVGKGATFIVYLPLKNNIIREELT
jgi:nitrogen-specific signal transduction histidine kinase